MGKLLSFWGETFEGLEAIVGNLFTQRRESVPLLIYYKLLSICSV